MPRPTKKPMGEPIVAPIPKGADTVRVTAFLTFDESDELRHFLRDNRKLGNRMGQMEYIRSAILRSLRERWIPGQPNVS